MDNFTDWKKEVFCLFVSGNEQKALEITANKRPNTLYKYYKLNRYTLENIQNELIWLSKPAEYNDPYDSMIQSYYPTAKFFFENAYISLYLNLEDNKMLKSMDDDLIKISNPANKIQLLISNMKKSEIKASSKDKLIINKIIGLLNAMTIEKYLGDIRNEFYENLLITCFAGKYNDILMWSHYGESNKGICIEYDIENYYATNQEVVCLPVIYQEFMFSYTRYPKCNSPYPEIMSKHTRWKYEDEWRFILQKPCSTNGKTIPQPKIKKIYLGSNFSFFEKENCRQTQYAYALLEIVQSRKIPLFKMRPQTNAYLLDAYEIFNEN